MIIYVTHTHIYANNFHTYTHNNIHTDTLTDI